MVGEARRSYMPCCVIGNFQERDSQGSRSFFFGTGKKGALRVLDGTRSWDGDRMRWADCRPNGSGG